MSKRPALELFGASLLDMMCCGLGAAIILFVLRQLDAANVLHAVEAARESVQSQTSTEVVRRDQSDRQARRVAMELRRAGRGTVFGFPPLRGPVCILIDTSGSMGQERKLETALSLVESLLRNNLSVSWLRVSRFNQEQTVVFQGELATPGAAQRRAQLDQVLKDCKSSTASGGTDVPKAIAAALEAMPLLDTGGAIVLISDGLSEGEVSAVLERLRAVNADDAGAGVTFHCVGLFTSDEIAKGGGLGDLLRRLAYEGRGVFLALPAPFDPAD